MNVYSITFSPVFILTLLFFFVFVFFTGVCTKVERLRAWDSRPHIYERHVLRVEQGAGLQPQQPLACAGQPAHADPCSRSPRLWHGQCWHLCTLFQGILWQKITIMMVILQWSPLRKTEAARIIRITSVQKCLVRAIILDTRVVSVQ